MSGKLTKAKLSKEIAKTCDLPLKESEQCLEIMLNAMVRSLSSGERVEIRGFGTFSTRVRKTRGGRNPKTGARVDVPAKRVPYFRTSQKLKDLINTPASDRIATKRS